jgi:hypothetical protein
MRLALLLPAVVLLTVGFVLHERKGVLEQHLGAVATQLAERRVHVHCQGLAGELVDVTAEAGTVWFDANGNPSDTTNLKRPICNALRRFRSDAASSRWDCVLANRQCDRRAFEDVLAVHTIAHESWHLRGIRDEAVTECKALQTTAQAAELLGADAQHADAAALYSITWFYPREPSEYRTPTCYDGGPLDLRPADPHWP